MTSLKTEALVNLSNILKDSVVQSHSKFQDIAKDITWLNNTMLHQSDLFLQIRQLEYSLLLVQQISDLFSSGQYVPLGKLPVSLVSPATIHSILTNI